MNAEQMAAHELAGMLHAAQAKIESLKRENAALRTAMTDLVGWQSKVCNAHMAAGSQLGHAESVARARTLLELEEAQHHA